MEWCGYKDCNKEATVVIVDAEIHGCFGSMCLQHADEFSRDMQRQAKAKEERYPTPLPPVPAGGW